MRWNIVREIAFKEIKNYFYSPVAYIVLAFFLIVSGIFFWTTFFLQNQAELRGYFNMLPWLFTFIIPAITMKIFSEEKSSGAYEVLVTLPLKLEEIIIGKFLAVVVFILSMVFFLFPYAISVDLVGDLDWGPVVSGAVGAFFLATSYGAIGVYASSLTKNQIIAFLVGLFICLAFFLVDKFFSFFPPSLLKIFNFFSSDKHFQNIAKGVLDLRDIGFFVLVVFVFIRLTYENLRNQLLKES